MAHLGNRLSPRWSRQRTLARKSTPQQGQTEEATLHCHVTGQPRPRVTWRRPELGTRPVLEAAPGGGFLVREAVVRDSGVYTCTATNRFGQAATCNTSLIVIGKQNCNLHLKLCK